LIAVAVFGTLLWEASHTQAKAAHQKIAEYFADFNDVRVAPHFLVIQCIGERYPLVAERTARMHAWLYNLFRKHQSIDLEYLRDMPKADARRELRGLEGMPPFAADYVAATGLGTHTVPLDERLLQLLVAQKIVADEDGLDTAQRFIEKATPADELVAVCALLRTWSDKEGHPPKREPNNAFAQPRFTAPSASKPSSGTERNNGAAPHAEPTTPDRGQAERVQAALNEQSKPTPEGESPAQSSARAEAAADNNASSVAADRPEPAAIPGASRKRRPKPRS